MKPAFFSSKNCLAQSATLLPDGSVSLSWSFLKMITVRKAVKIKFVKLNWKSWLHYREGQEKAGRQKTLSKETSSQIWKEIDEKLHQFFHKIKTCFK